MAALRTKPVLLITIILTVIMTCLILKGSQSTTDTSMGKIIQIDDSEKYRRQRDAIPMDEEYEPFSKRNAILYYEPSEVLLPFAENAPDTVHMIWCGTQWFEFKHFLSLLSIMKIQQPGKVVIHHWGDDPIKKDGKDYNIWYWQLTKEYYNIMLSKIGDVSPDCNNGTSMLLTVADILNNGGIYISNTVILTRHLHQLRKNSLSVGVSEKQDKITFSSLAYVVAKKGASEALIPEENVKSYENVSECLKSGDLEKTNKFPSDAQCVQLQDNIIPAKKMETSDGLSQLVRLVYYGSPEPKLPKWSMENPISNIGHMVLLGGHEMNMLTYLSIRSMIHCVGAEAMYIYVDKVPRGQWYEKLRDKEPRAVFVYREWPEFVFGIRMTDVAHASDIMRIEMIHRFGGIYVDWDAIMLRPLGNLRGYEFISDFDFPLWAHPFPDILNHGVCAGKKGSEFARKTLLNFREYNKTADWLYMGGLMSYKFYEQHPETIKIERKLQVQCYDLKCHPVWLPNYHDWNTHHLNGNVFDWKEVYAFHWTLPSPKELMNMTVLLNTNSMFADIGKYILSCDRDQTIENLS